MIDTEAKEMLTVYDGGMNPIGERTHAEVHEQGLLHKTVRLWTIRGQTIYFQVRSRGKKLFPRKLDPSATGHIDPGEEPIDAALREAAEEIGVSIPRRSVEHAGSLPLPFTRPDGKLDNEFAEILVWSPDEQPAFRPGPEVDAMAAVSVADYDRMLRAGEPVEARLSIRGKVRMAVCGPDRFCLPSMEEWRIVKRASCLQKEIWQPEQPQAEKWRRLADIPDIAEREDDGYGPCLP